jgi:hypothetical protein
MNTRRFIARSAMLIIVSVAFSQAYALPDGSAPPDMMDMSATFAKARAQMRAYAVDMRDLGIHEDPFAIGALDTQGCDINIGNVVLDDTSQSPDDIVVFVQGDIIQSNNCR